MSSLTFTITAVGQPDSEDQAAFVREIRTENQRITRENQIREAEINALNAARALQDPPLEPLPFSPAPLLEETLVAYESLLAIFVSGAHSASVQRAADEELTLLRQRYESADAATRDEVKTTLQFQPSKENERER